VNCSRSSWWTPRNRSFTPVSANTRQIIRTRFCAAEISAMAPLAVSCRVSGFSPWALRTTPERCSATVDMNSIAEKTSKPRPPDEIGRTACPVFERTGTLGALFNRSAMVNSLACSSETSIRWFRAK
jgi:hypothetical protein